MKKLLILFVFGIAACEDHDSDVSKRNEIIINTCGVSDPTQELPWLKERITEIEQSSNDLGKYFYFVQGTYKNQTVFMGLDCCPTCDTVWTVSDCEGNLLFYMHDSEANDIKDKHVIWRAQDSPCQL